jgi:hypothetical protein
MNWRPAQCGLMKKVTLIFVGVAAVFLGRVECQVLEPGLSKDRPLLEVNLAKYGYEVPHNYWPLDKPLVFIDSARLAWAWVTIDDVKTSQRPTPVPAHLHVLVLDAKTGQKLGLQEWPTPSVPVRFLGLRDGKFFIVTGEVIRLLSPNFEIIHEETLASDPACLNSGPFCEGLTLSASRRILLLTRYHSAASYLNSLFDSETFAPVTSWSDDFPVAAMSDHWLVAHCGKHGELCVRQFDEPWRAFQTTTMKEAMKDTYRKDLLFVSDDTLIITAWSKIVVAKIAGTDLFQVALPKNKSFGNFVASAGGERFAVIENRKRGLTVEVLDMYAFPSAERIVVYSIPDRRAIYALKVKGASPWPSYESHVNQFALSPDGTLLASVSDGVLKVYRLPDGNSR